MLDCKTNIMMQANLHKMLRQKIEERAGRMF
jgi:hypothetical protein